MNFLPKTLPQAAFIAATAVTTPIFADSPALAFPKVANIYDEHGFVFPATLAPLETSFASHNFAGETPKKTAFKTDGNGTTGILPELDLGVDAARFTALYGTSIGAVTPMGPLFIHSAGNAKDARVDFGLMAGGLTASIGLEAKIYDGNPFTVDYAGTSYSFPTTNIETARVLSISKAWDVGQNWSIAGKDVDDAMFAIGISAQTNAQRIQFTTIGGDNYPTEMSEEKWVRPTINVGLVANF